MGRQAREGYKTKSLRLHQESYEIIREYCNAPVTGIYAANVIDVVLQAIAQYFQTRLEQDESIDHKELSKLPQKVYKIMDEISESKNESV